MTTAAVAAACCRLRAELRHRWRFVAAAALMLGLAGGAALAGAAGARRAGTVVTRMVAATDTEDVLVLPESDGATRGLTASAVAAIPGVRDMTQLIGFAGIPVGATEPNISLMVPAATAPGTTRQDRPETAAMLVRAGRAPDPANPDEVMANEAAAAAYGWKAGQTVHLRIIPSLNLDNAADAGIDPFAAILAGRLGEVRSFHLVGVGLSLADAVLPGQQGLLFTRAFYEQTHAGPIYDGFMVHLDERATSVSAFQAAVHELVPGEQVAFRTRESVTATEQRAVQPQVVTLWAVAAVMAVVGLAVWALAAGRRAREDGEEDRTLAALGATAETRLLVDGGRALAVGILGAVIAVAIAALTSPLLPLGEARHIEPHLGFDLDGPVLAGGAAVLVASAVALGVLASIRSVGVERPMAEPSALGRAARTALPTPAAGTGVGYALERGSSAARSTPRSTLAGAAGGVLVTLAALTFAVNLDRFVRTPADFGWGFDVVVQTGGLGDQGVDPQPVFDELSSDHDVRGWARSVVLQGSVDGRTESLLGLQQVGGQSVGPTVLSGHLPTADDEVALGAITARHAGVHVGDTVTVGTADHHAEFSVVGTVVLPGLRNNSSDAAALGEGAALTVGGLTNALQLDPGGTLATTLLIDLADGADASAVVERLMERLPPDVTDGLSASGPTLAPSADGPVTPAEVVAYHSVRATPVLLAAALAVLSAFTVGLALVASVRRRRRELGTLRALGLTGGQIRGLVAWQATAVAVVSAVVGAPLGVLLGRQAWLAVAHRLGVQASVAVPWLVLALAVPVAILVTNLVAFVPGRRAAYAVAAEALRSE